MPAFDILPTVNVAATLATSFSQGSPTFTITIKSTQTGLSGATRSPSLFSPGVVGVISVVSVLVAICMVTAAFLHRSWCVNPGCMVCRILKHARRKTQNDIAWEKRLSNLPTFATNSVVNSPTSPEKSGSIIQDRSPLDRHFLSYGEQVSPSQARLQEIGGSKPQYSTARSIVSNVAVITTPSAEPTIAGDSPLPSSSSGQAATPDQGQEQSPAGRLAGGANHPPSAFDSTGHSRSRSRASQVSGWLSTITLPSFITHERTRPHSTSAGMQAESPIRPHQPSRRRYSVFGQRFGGSDSALPASPANDENASGRRSRPTSGSLHIVTSALRRSSTVASPVRTSSRRSLGRLNLPPGDADEAAIEWKRLPPLPSGVHPASQGCVESAAIEPATERLPSYHENESEPPLFLPLHIPLPPSPSTVVSSVSSLSYAPPSPEDVPPTNRFRIPYTAYPPLPPSVPSTPGQLSHPASLYSVDASADSRTAYPTDRTAALAITTLDCLPGEPDWADPNLATPMTTTTVHAYARNHESFFPSSPDDYDEVELPAYRRSMGSTYSQHSHIQEVELPPPPLPTVPMTPPPPVSPRGPRPLPPTPGQQSRSGTSSSRMSSIGL